jgi:hypothetical protein
MIRNVYNAASLRRVLGELEECYGTSSADLLAAHLAGESLEHIPRFHRHVWLSFYREAGEMSGDDFAERAGRVLALA